MLKMKQQKMKNSGYTYTHNEFRYKGQIEYEGNGIFPTFRRSLCLSNIPDCIIYHFSLDTI